MGESCCSTCEQFAGKESDPIERRPIAGSHAQFKIRIREKGGEPYEYTPTGPEVTIGRVEGNDIKLPKGNVSKRASRIAFRDNAATIVDLKSSCGTYVDGRKITSAVTLGENAKIYIGDFMLEVVRV